MYNKNILVVGPSGSGKTYIVEKLRHINVNAWDGDQIVGLCKWVDSEGNGVNFPENASEGWLSKHKFVWDINFLEKWLKNQGKVLLFGLSSNVFDSAYLFDKVFYLDISEEDLVKRLSNHKRQNPMGKTEYQKQIILKSMNRLKENAINIGSEIIDATLTLEEILKIINK